MMAEVKAPPFGGGGENGTKAGRRNRTNYRCSKCGQPKRGHVCPYQPRVIRTDGEKPPETRTIGVQVEVDARLVVRHLQLEAQGRPESYGEAANMVVPSTLAGIPDVVSGLPPDVPPPLPPPTEPPMPTGNEAPMLFSWRLSCAWLRPTRWGHTNNHPLSTSALCALAVAPPLAAPSHVPPATSCPLVLALPAHDLFIG
eukprot:CAMPEP_0197421732 /NCGR_PEP_ID=MMETSP1170-20131217/10750_1 /TAXON_ID=54406 /ORGANISM="Sarcinochrysis sp, Strain CCMP770" /LENGTH=198 /DNA_ID=CAMNT_0042949007 /DNA_START=21 /DNA_END=621 /DNA_ORIENTATION=+